MRAKRDLEQPPGQLFAVDVEALIDEGRCFRGDRLEPAVADRVTQILEAFKGRSADAFQNSPVFPVGESQSLKTSPFGRGEADVFTGHESEQTGGRENGLA